ncbi:uncharacterized protein BT62DRAFT_269582 [Guyanagaster necrorhizus]|uniref:Uncharacterized protein n=1 Tax=Guyanagaster necrorhizus TaxID=856835 RepID=A0A9P7W3B7_9AGAR|nr:uncharacterized protein BT62DRAFT_269582 [Guyanagaster necrorhizus MCA 3950]KAG7451877.1 hypothetical protein BT62DRAFT_269582 [Guyanagaster necrorhizus MCA 3950]
MGMEWRIRRYVLEIEYNRRVGEGSGRTRKVRANHPLVSPSAFDHFRAKVSLKAFIYPFLIPDSLDSFLFPSILVLFLASPSYEGLENSP